MEAFADYKAYVGVKAEFNPDGVMLPRALTWEDGVTYEIDRVVDIRPSFAAKAGGQGDRYTVMVQGQKKYLFFERTTNVKGNVIGRWFVERRIPKLRCSSEKDMEEADIEEPEIAVDPEITTELFNRLRKIRDDKRFILGTLGCVSGIEDQKALLNYIKTGIKVSTDSVACFAFNLQCAHAQKMEEPHRLPPAPRYREEDEWVS